MDDLRALKLRKIRTFTICPIRGRVKVGAGTRSRTRDLLIPNQLLYQLSYAGYLGLWAGRRFAQEYPVFAVLVDDRTRALAGRQGNVDEEHRGVARHRRDRYFET